MLVLTRKVDERLKIGHGITITVVECREGRVRLGIEAPADMPIHRQEVYDSLYGAQPPVAEAVTDSPS